MAEDYEIEPLVPDLDHGEYAADGGEDDSTHVDIGEELDGPTQTELHDPYI